MTNLIICIPIALFSQVRAGILMSLYMYELVQSSKMTFFSSQVLATFQVVTHHLPRYSLPVSVVKYTMYVYPTFGGYAMAMLKWFDDSVPGNANDIVEDTHSCLSLARQWPLFAI